MIELGYNGKLRKEFEGYIVNVEEKIPLIIKLEGLSFILRNTTLAATSFKHGTLKEVIEYALIGTGIVLNQKIPVVFIRNYTIAKGVNTLHVIADIIEKHLLSAYFKEHELYVGLTQQFKSGLVKYDLKRNVISKENLRWKENEPVQLTMKIEDGSGKRKTLRAGKENGRLVDLGKGSLLNEEFYLKLLENKAATEESIGGYEGEFETFLIPNVEPGYEAHILNDDYPEKNSAYFVSSVTTKMSTAGARRTVEINGKLIL